MQIERYHLFAIGLAVFLSVLFYSILGMRQDQDWDNSVFKGPSAAAPVPPADFDEFDKEIEQLAGNLEDPADARRTFKEMADRVEGGSDWLLLRMAAIRNRDRTYDAGLTAVPPEFLIALDTVDAEQNRALFRLQITNPSDTLLTLPRVPETVRWVFTGPIGQQREIAGSLPRTAAGPDIVRLEGRTFWGILVNVDVSSLERGAWDVTVELGYAARETGGAGLVSGNFVSNRVAIGL